MAAEWSLRVGVDGWVELTLGPSPRKTVPLSLDEGRELGTMILQTVDIAERLLAMRAEKREL